MLKDKFVELCQHSAFSNVDKWVGVLFMATVKFKFRDGHVAVSKKKLQAVLALLGL